jgi:sporulation protein YlmC with PRC-barrel domain
MQGMRVDDGPHHDKETEDMKRSALVNSVATCICLGLATPLLAAEPPIAGTTSSPPPSSPIISAAKPAEKCLSDLRSFDGQMEKEGYWLGGSGYGYGYPMVGYGYGYEGDDPMNAHPGTTATGYRTARPGYDVRILFAAANILARGGQQQACEEVLATTREIYKLYVSDMHGGGMPMADLAGWRRQQIAGAQPVSNSKTAFRSDELLGTDVRNGQNEALGSVDDLVMSPQTGKIAYLVVARGGIFGIDREYVPVPWEDFKVTANGKLLVLDTTKVVLEAAPRVSHDQFARPGNFDQQGQKVDAYWKAHSAAKTQNRTNG